MDNQHSFKLYRSGSNQTAKLKHFIQNEALNNLHNLKSQQCKGTWGIYGTPDLSRDMTEGVNCGSASHSDNDESDNSAEVDIDVESYEDTEETFLMDADHDYENEGDTADDAVIIPMMKETVIIVTVAKNSLTEALN